MIFTPRKCRKCGSQFLPKGNCQPFCSVDCRFWDKVLKTPTCWLWQARIGDDGYGQFGSHEMFRAHRVAYELECGQIPADLLVLHSCDNPPCVRPSHLFLGTQADNIKDMMSKGRGRVPIGEQNGASKLTHQEVIQIKKLLSAGRGVVAISRDFNVERHAIQKIKAGKTWIHV